MVSKDIGVAWKTGYFNAIYPQSDCTIPHFAESGRCACTGQPRGVVPTMGAVAVPVWDIFGVGDKDNEQ